MKLLKIFLTAVALTWSSISLAWEPPKEVTVIVGFQPGSGNEIAFRKLAQLVSEKHPNTTFIVRHMAGADSVTSMNHFVTQPNDGSVIAIPSHMGTYVTNDVWQKNVKKFTQDDFISVLTMGKSPLVLVASKNSKVNTTKEFVDLIKNPDRPVFVAVGGGAHRTAYEYIMYKVGGNRELVRNVNFQGPQPAVESVSKFDGKEGTEFGIMPIAVANAMVEAGLVKPIGLTGTRLMPQMPNTPLLADVIPGVDVYAAWTLALPKGTDKNIVDWYQKAFGDAVKSPQYKEWADKNIVFIETNELTPDGVAAQIAYLRNNFLPVLSTLVSNNEGK